MALLHASGSAIPCLFMPFLLYNNGAGHSWKLHPNACKAEQPLLGDCFVVADRQTDRQTDSCLICDHTGYKPCILAKGAASAAVMSANTRITVRILFTLSCRGMLEVWRMRRGALASLGASFSIYALPVTDHATAINISTI